MVSYGMLLAAISLTSVLWQVSQTSCLGSGCTCYEGIARVDCDGGRATMIPDLVKMMTEELNFDHVLQGSLTYLDLVNNWPSLKKLNFYTASVYVCRWIDSVIVPDTVVITSQCKLPARKNGRSRTTVAANGFTGETMMTVKEHMRGLVTSHDMTTVSSGLDNVTSSNNTKELFDITMKFSNGELVVTVVTPICLVISATLIICIKWKLTNPSGITMEFKLKKLKKRGIKTPKSPPPESAEFLVDSWDEGRYNTPRHQGNISNI